MPFWSYILTALAGYLLGSIPTGFLAAKAKGIDIRKIGSGNIGATNAMRVLGTWMGILVLLTDAFKGWYACMVGYMVCFHYLPQLSHRPGADVHSTVNFILEVFPLIAGVFAVLGHNFPCWLKFKGGKGIATTAGVYLALAPWAVLAALMIFVLAVLLTRFVSIGSITAAVALPAAVWVMSPDNLLLGIVTTALGIMAIYKHKSNIQRLLAGTENRLGSKPQSQPPKESK